MPEDYEELLMAGLFEPPDDFADKVMARIAEQPFPDFPVPASRGRERIQWLALIAASLIGAIQLAGFMFGIWSATSAG